MCHRADGPGGPESAALAGLPKEYIIRQIEDFKSGAREPSVPKLVPPRLMIEFREEDDRRRERAGSGLFFGTDATSDDQGYRNRDGAKTRVAGWFLTALPGGEKEPIAGRIIEVPEHPEQFEMRDSHSHFIAYVPPGSVEKGRQFVESGGDGKTAPCTICHGPNLKGLGPIPGIAGRSPSYIVRQLYDFQHGARTGPWSPLMAPNVVKLTIDDMVSLAAYAASLQP